jgi:hypothetical protein
MDKVQTRNDLTAAVPKFCLSLETHRRTSEGRVRTSQEFLTHFFPHDASSSTDRLFRYMPNDVRGPVLAAWGIRGAKAALRDDDAKVQSVVHDALVAGDIDHAAFEEGLGADTVVRWAPLAEWWTFWRGGKLSKVAIQKALAVAYDLLLFDAKWFFDTIEGRGGKLRGTDVIADGLSKDDLTEWMRNVHKEGDGSPKGILTAIGWDKIVAKTANEVLIAVIDAMVQKAGLVKAAGPAPEKPSGAALPPTTATPAATPAAIAQAAPASSDSRQTKPPHSEAAGDIEWPDEPAGGKPHAVPETETTVSQKGDILAGPDSSAADDGMIVVVDDEMDMGSTDATAVHARGENDPPTAPRLEAAPPVPPDDEAAPLATKEKGSKRSARPEPAAPPVPPPRNTRAPAR